MIGMYRITHEETIYSYSTYIDEVPRRAPACPVWSGGVREVPRHAQA